jgi:ATP-binding cassette ChvD family protein
MKGLGKVYPPKRKVLEDIWLSFLPGAKIGVLGLNGSGKSTLLKIMAGIDDDFIGEAWAAPGVTVGYLPQEPELDPKKTVMEVVEEGVAETKALLDEFEAINMKFAEPMDDAAMDKLLARQAKVQDAIDAVGAWELDRKLEIAMDALRLPPADENVAHLSGGEKRRIALCRLLLQQPDMLLLDEPTNHLDAESVAWLEKYLHEYPGTVVAITHDRYFLDNVAGWILELDRGRGIPWEGNYSSWLEQKEKRLAQEEKQSSSRQKTLERELEWIRMTPKARHAKNKARISNYENMLQQGSFEKAEAGTIAIPPGPRLGDVVIEAKGLSKAFGERLIFDEMTFSLPPGGIVGIIGPNGAGKTTLLKMLSGMDTPDTGELKVGTTVKVAYVDQSRDDLDAERTVWEEISGGVDTIEVGKRQISSRAYVGAFNFKGSDQQKRVCDLSGGERNRVHLAKLLKKGANLILLDEPTNDLDIDTLRSMEQALLDFAGCVVVVSHDRWFLDRIATHILAFEGDSSAVWFEGNYQDYETDKKRRLGEDATQPHRIKYKKLIH